MKSLFRALAVLALVCFGSVDAHAQTAVAVTPVPKQQFFDNSGAPLAGGLLSTFSCGTNTPLATYTDASGLYQNSNPITLDSAGRAVIFVAQACYKYVLQNSFGVQIWVIDGVQTYPTNYSALTVGTLTATSTTTNTLVANTSITSPSIADTSLMAGDCLQSVLGGFLSSTALPCFVPAGTVCYVTNCPLVAPSFTGMVSKNTTLTGSTSIGLPTETVFNSSGQIVTYSGQTILNASPFGGIRTEIAGSTLNTIPASCATRANSLIFTNSGHANQPFELTYYVQTQGAGAAGTYTFNVSWTDAAGQAQSVTSSTINLAIAGSMQSGTVPIFSGPVTNITVSTTPSGGAGATCTGYYVLEQF